jgi:hypothetical protein
VSEALSGMSPAEATIQLEQMLAIEGPPTITLRPRFIPWRWLPRKAGRISVTFAGPESLIEDEESEDGEATASSAEDASATATASP